MTHIGAKVLAYFNTVPTDMLSSIKPLSVVITRTLANIILQYIGTFIASVI